LQRKSNSQYQELLREVVATALAMIIRSNFKICSAAVQRFKNIGNAPFELIEYELK